MHVLTIDLIVKLVQRVALAVITAKFTCQWKPQVYFEGTYSQMSQWHVFPIEMRNSRPLKSSQSSGSEGGAMTSVLLPTEESKLYQPQPLLDVSLHLRIK
jgi:hypothetical protein